MNNCQTPQQAACGNMLLEVFENKEVLRFYFSDVGDKGLSAYEVAVQEGFVGTIDEWLESLVGPPVPVAQELGDDPDLAVSQKLLKDSIDSMEQSNSEAVAEAERLNNLSQQAASSAAESELNASASAESASSSALSAAQSASESEASAEQSLQSAISSESSAQSAASNAQSATDSAELAAASALAAKASEGSAKGSAEQAESSAKRADAVAEIVEDKFDKSKVVGELGDRDDLVINQARVTLELNTLYRQIELLTAWSGHEIPKQPLYADFIGQRYAKDGKPCRFEDIFEFTRLSKAWQFEGGKLEEYGINEPRFSGKGLLIEPESTNFIPRSTDMSNEYWDRNRTVVSGNNLAVDTSDGVHNLMAPSRSVPQYNHKRSQRLIFKRNNARYLSFGTFGGTGTAGIVFDLDTLKFVYTNSINFGDFIEDFCSVINLGDDYYDMIVSVDDFGAWNTIGMSYPFIQFYKELSHASGSRSFVGDGVTNIDVVYAGATEGINKSSPIITTETTVTRLPETLTVLTDSNFTIEADEGIQVNGNEITGFGYIRKLEVK